MMFKQFKVYLQAVSCYTCRNTMANWINRVFQNVGLDFNTEIEQGMTKKLNCSSTARVEPVPVFFLSLNVLK